MTLDLYHFPEQERLIKAPTVQGDDFRINHETVYFSSYWKYAYL